MGKNIGEGLTRSAQASREQEEAEPWVFTLEHHSNFSIYQAFCVYSSNFNFQIHPFDWHIQDILTSEAIIGVAQLESKAGTRSGMEFEPFVGKARAFAVVGGFIAVKSVGNRTSLWIFIPQE